MTGIPLNTLIRPCVSHLARTYGFAGGPAPEAMIAAIGLQESGWKERDQLEVQNGKLVPGVVGPATGFGQFEKNGGVIGVMTHPASSKAARELCEAAGVPFEKDAIWRSFATIAGDELHVAFMRLLLATDPQPLPFATASSSETAFSYYLRNWRPGAWFNSPPESQKRKELRDKWERNWIAALGAIGPEVKQHPVVRPPATVSPSPVFPDAHPTTSISPIPVWPIGAPTSAESKRTLFNDMDILFQRIKEMLK